MYFNSMNNVSLDFMNEDYDLQDLEIIEELSKYPNNVLLLCMITKYLWILFILFVCIVFIYISLL